MVCRISMNYLQNPDQSRDEFNLKGITELNLKIHMASNLAISICSIKRMVFKLIGNKALETIQTMADFQKMAF